MMWDAAVRANTPRAFATYLNRYPRGLHAEDAEAAIDHLRRMPPQPEPAVAVADAPVAEARLGPVAPQPASAPVAEATPLPIVVTATGGVAVERDAYAVGRTGVSTVIGIPAP